MKKRIEIDANPVKNEDLIPIPAGKEITEEFAEELAEEAERGYADVDKWERVYLGRPSLSKDGPSPRGDHAPRSA